VVNRLDRTFITPIDREDIYKLAGDLDDVIDRLVLDPGQDRLQLQRLKKRKLLLKDQIARLRTRLIPDIIA